jgi:hypothetical protein
MDITPNDLKTMKAKQLRRIVHEAIKEVLKEDANALITTKSGTKSVSYKNPAELSKLKQDTNVSSIETTGGQKIKEMARIAKGFRLADPEMDSSSYADKKITTQNTDAEGRKTKASLADIIEYVRENPGAEKIDIFNHFNFARPQISNAVVNALLDAGVLVKLGAGGEVEPTAVRTTTPAEPGAEPSGEEEDNEEEPTVQATEPEDLFMGSAENPLAMYFDNVPNDDGSEDFESEPTEPEVSTAAVTAAEPEIPSQSQMSDEDYDAFMKYTDLKQRLDAVKGNLIKIKRAKGTRTAGDISDEPTGDIERLTNLKKSLEDKVNALVASSDYLKKRTEKSSEQELDEWETRRLQYYAGIRK